MHLSLPLIKFRKWDHDWVREERLTEELVEELELFLWLCIHTLKTCLVTPTLLQNLSISSSTSFLCSFHPSFSANPNIFSFCSALNFVLNLFLLLPPPLLSPISILPSPPEYSIMSPLPPVTTCGPSTAGHVTLRWKLRWQPQAMHWREGDETLSASRVNSPQPSVA